MIPREAFDLSSYRWNTRGEKKPKGVSGSFQVKRPSEIRSSNGFDSVGNWLILSTWMVLNTEQESIAKD